MRSETETLQWTTMARPREFDEADALDAATDCFWRDGYEATSVRDLAARMGITGASLYNAFGDKRSLFREVLQRYADPPRPVYQQWWETRPLPWFAHRFALLSRFAPNWLEWMRSFSRN